MQLCHKNACSVLSCSAVCHPDPFQPLPSPVLYILLSSSMSPSILSCSVLVYPVLPCLGLPCPTLSCSALSYSCLLMPCQSTFNYAHEWGWGIEWARALPWGQLKSLHTKQYNSTWSWWMLTSDVDLLSFLSIAWIHGFSESFDSFPARADGLIFLVVTYLHRPPLHTVSGWTCQQGWVSKDIDPLYQSDRSCLGFQMVVVPQDDWHTRHNYCLLLSKGFHYTWPIQSQNQLGAHLKSVTQSFWLLNVYWEWVGVLVWILTFVYPVCDNDMWDVSYLSKIYHPPGRDRFFLGVGAWRWKLIIAGITINSFEWEPVAVVTALEGQLSMG